jgi:hypothetical protein
VASLTSAIYISEAEADPTIEQLTYEYRGGDSNPHALAGSGF